MTGTALTALSANLALSPETGLISIHTFDASCHITCREASNHAFCQAYSVCQRANMQASALSIRFLDAGQLSIRSSSFREYF